MNVLKLTARHRARGAMGPGVRGGQGVEIRGGGGGSEN